MFVHMQKYERLYNLFNISAVTVSLITKPHCMKKEADMIKGRYLVTCTVQYEKELMHKILVRKYQHARSAKNLERNHGRDIGENRDGIFKLLRSPGIDSKESIPPAYEAWRASTTTLFLLGS
jgi:hypothetical protein